MTLDALEPFLMTGPQQTPQPLPYLRSETPGNYDISLKVEINGKRRSALVIAHHLGR